VPSKEVGDVFKCIGCVLRIDLVVQMAKTLGTVDKNKTFWDFTILGDVFCQPLGENTFSKNAQFSGKTHFSKKV